MKSSVTIFTTYNPSKRMKTTLLSPRQEGESDDGVLRPPSACKISKPPRTSTLLSLTSRSDSQRVSDGSTTGPLISPHPICSPSPVSHGAGNTKYNTSGANCSIQSDGGRSAELNEHHPYVRPFPKAPYIAFDLQPCMWW